jgi:hypothetical protein
VRALAAGTSLAVCRSAGSAASTPPWTWCPHAQQQQPSCRDLSRAADTGGWDRWVGVGSTSCLLKARHSLLMAATASCMCGCCCVRSRHVLVRVKGRGAQAHVVDVREQMDSMITQVKACISRNAAPGAWRICN